MKCIGLRQCSVSQYKSTEVYTRNLCRLAQLFCICHKKVTRIFIEHPLVCQISYTESKWRKTKQNNNNNNNNNNIINRNDQTHTVLASSGWSEAIAYLLSYKAHRELFWIGQSNHGNHQSHSPTQLLQWHPSFLIKSGLLNLVGCLQLLQCQLQLDSKRD